MTSREGLALIGRTFFDSQANWYLMLGTGSLPAGTGTLADWAALESTGTGYTRQAIAGTSVAVSYDGTDTIYTCPQVTDGRGQRLGRADRA